MKKRKRKLATYRRLCVIAAVATIVGFVVTFGLSYLAKDWLIIAFGIRAANHLCRVLLVITGICLMATLSSAIPLLNDAVQKKQQQREQQKLEETKIRALKTYAEEGATPENTLAVLLQIIETMPSFKALALDCHAQMEKMDELQKRQHDLISSNGAQYLEGTKSVLDGVEKRLCRNVWSIRNLCVAAGNLEQLDSGKAQTYLDDNNAKLKDSERLLNVSVEWINQYDRNGEADLGEVNHWINAIEKSLKEDIF